MPLFNWFAVKEDMGRLLDAALSHPKRLEGLCIVERTATSPDLFVPHFTLNEAIRQRIDAVSFALFMLERDIPGLSIEKGPEFLDRESPYYINLNESTTTVQICIPHIFQSEGHLLLNPSRMSYYPSKWCPTEGRRVKAPPETLAIFRFLRSWIKEFAKPGLLGKLMTPDAREMFMTNGVLFSNDGIWYDASGAVRGRCHGPSGFSEI
ncbi:MAG: hypothetical protein ACK5EA_13865 [Planctomycetaceae bacterium]|jgi:hypothetical protein